MKKKICGIDGIAIFVKDPKLIDHLEKNAERYKLRAEYDVVSGAKLGGMKGNFKNLKISYQRNKRGRGILISGSLHKFFKDGLHNYDTFYWSDFLFVLDEIIREFKFDPELTDIWSLELGLNNELVMTDGHTGTQLLKNILLLKRNGKSSSRKKHPNDGYSLIVFLGDCIYKIYDKGRQFNLQYELIRTECNCKRRPLAKFGINTFKDLCDYDKHQKYAEYLLKSFDSLIIFQPEILAHPNLKEEDKLFLLSYDNPNAWLKLIKERSNRFKESKQKLFSLNDKYTDINYRTEILNSMSSQIYA